MENQPTTKQVVVFTMILSFIVSTIATVLTTGVLGFGSGDGSGGVR